LPVLETLRRLRHGPLSRFDRVWVPLGRLARFVIAALPRSTVKQRIGPFGPFRLDAHFAFSNFEAWGQGHNNGFLATIEACRGKDCVFDIGGHIGLVTLPMSRVVSPAGRVFSFEPGEANLDFLRFHLARNGAANVEVVDALVGDSDGWTDFFEQSGATGQNSVVLKKNHEAYQRVRRRQVSLDRFCADSGLRPEIIKVDVEGAELAVLRGARETLRRDRPTLFLSVHPTELRLLGESTESLMREIDDLGYVCLEIDGKPVSAFRLAEYLMLPKEQASGHAAQRD